MKTYILTSDFPMELNDAFVKQLTSLIYKRESFVFVASNFEDHQTNILFMNYILNKFKKSEIIFDRVSIIDNDMDYHKASQLIQSADIVWLSGGPTLKQIKDIEAYPGLIDALQKRDGVTVGLSAGSINMAKRVVLAKDIDDDVHRLSVYQGIGLVDVNIEPHLDSATKEHIEDIKEAAKVAPIYGLYDNSFIVINEDGMNIYGKYKLFK